jgi:hypothetical protein
MALSERSSYQEHFRDLCAMLRQPTPTDVDPDGSFYTLEKVVEKSGGGKRFADVAGQRYAKRALEVAAAGGHNVVTLGRNATRPRASHLRYGGPGAGGRGGAGLAIGRSWAAHGTAV